MNTVQSSHGGGGSGKEKGIEVSTKTACTIIIIITTHNMLYHYNNATSSEVGAHVIIIWIKRVPMYNTPKYVCYRRPERYYYWYRGTTSVEIGKGVEKTETVLRANSIMIMRAQRLITCIYEHWVIHRSCSPPFSSPLALI